MELLLGYGAGLLTLINPCVLPILPIVLASALQAHRHGPLAMAAGMSVTFVVFGLSVATVGNSIGITEELLGQIGATLMIGFGLVLLVPRLSARFATATAGLSAQADTQMDAIDRHGLRGQFLGGMLLGVVWSPCIGPTLGGAISLASQGQSLAWAASIMVAFSLGVATIIVALGYGTRSVIIRRQAALRGLAQRSRPIMGAVFVAVGVMILLSVHKQLEFWALDVLPIWLQDLSVAL